MDDDAGSSGALTLVAPAPGAPPVVVRPVHDTDHLLRLEHVRRRLVADTVALVSWDEDALQVVSLSGARLSGSTAMAVGVACAEADHRPQACGVRASAGDRSVFVTRLPQPDGAGTPALVVVEPRTLVDLSPDAVGTALRKTFSTP